MPTEASAASPERRPVPFTAQGQRFGPGLSVALRGELDLATVEIADPAVRHAARHAKLVALDLRELSFIDGAGVGFLLAADARLRATGARLIVVDGPPRVHRVFELVHATASLELLSPATAELVAAGREPRRPPPPLQRRSVGGEGSAATVRVLPYAAEHGQACVIVVEGRLDVAALLKLESQLSAAIERDDPHIILDLIAVTGMTTGTLSTLCTALRQLRHRHGTLAVVGADARVRRILELMELEDVDLEATVHAVLVREAVAGSRR